MYTHSVWSVKSVPAVKWHHRVKQELHAAAEKHVSTSDVAPQVPQWWRCDQRGSRNRPLAVTPVNHQSTVQRSKFKVYTLFSGCSQRNKCTVKARVKSWVFKPSLSCPRLLAVEQSCVRNKFQTIEIPKVEALLAESSPGPRNEHGVTFGQTDMCPISTQMCLTLHETSLKS